MRPEIKTEHVNETTTKVIVGDLHFHAFMPLGEFLRRYHRFQQGTPIWAVLPGLSKLQQDLLCNGAPEVPEVTPPVEVLTINGRKFKADKINPTGMGPILKVLALVLTGALGSAASALDSWSAQAEVSQNETLLGAIQRVETGGQKNPAKAVGDHGLAHGWYQMHPDYYDDAKQESPWLPSYEVCCADKHLSQLCVVSVWAKYKINSDKWRTLLHHYGPSGRPHKKNSSDKDLYWPKCQESEMRKLLGTHFESSVVVAHDFLVKKIGESPIKESINIFLANLEMRFATREPRILASSKVDALTSLQFMAFNDRMEVIVFTCLVLQALETQKSNVHLN